MTAGVSIILDGEEVTLVASAQAAIAISRRAEGLLPAVEKVLRFDRDLIVGAIALGLTIAPEILEEKIDRSDMSALMPAVAQFIQVLANGGKPIDDEAPLQHWAAPTVH